MAKRSIIGAREVPEPIVSGPPKVEDVLTEVGRNWLGSGYVHGAAQDIPRDPYDLASWWVNRQAKSSAFDRPTQHTKRDGSGTYWKSPYVDRMKYTLTKFLVQDKEFQRLIIAAAEDGIFWRGDSREFFVSVIAESGKTKQAGYRSEAIAKMRSFVGA